MSTLPADRKSSEKPPADSQEKQPSRAWLDGLASYWLRFDRFGWDFLGVFLLVFSLLILLGMTHLTQGSFISPLAQVVEVWLGWGGYALAGLLAMLGVALLRRGPDGSPQLSLGRILAWEGAAFTLLALLALIGGLSVERAEAGLDGGKIGWGLADLLTSFLPPPWITILLGLLLVLFLWYAVGLSARAGAVIRRWVERALQEAEAWQPEPSAPAEALDGLVKTARTAAPAGSTGEAEEEQSSASTPYVRPDNLPPINLLLEEHSASQDPNQIQAVGRQIEKTLAEFGVPSRVIGYRVGPTVTQYAVEPGYVEKTGPDGQVIHQKVRVHQISNLSRDLARALAAERLRIEAPVPGHAYVGVEVPNTKTSVVRLRSLIDSDAFRKVNAPLAIALGKDVSGNPLVADLAKMPHLLVAGTTGSGKSVCIEAITTCLVMNNSPESLRMAMLDPKMVELVRFNGLPHLLGRVETRLERMLAVLQWALSEMDRRYRLLEEAKARDLDAYNRKMVRRKQETLPRIVILVDELADLMMSAPDQTEHALVRLAQMARAVGIHLVVATQRPSTDVVTGLIKANFPARIAFTVASSVDSRVILDTNGAETLLGRGDMLYLAPDVGLPQRAQGVLVSDEEIERVVSFWAEKHEAEGEPAEAPWEGLMKVSEDSDQLVEQAVALVRRTQRASASFLQRQLRIGYPRAARLLDQLEEMGVVGPATVGGKEREVLLDPENGDEDTPDGEDEGYN